jgi:hypothetical protein
MYKMNVEERLEPNAMYVVLKNVAMLMVGCGF